MIAPDLSPPWEAYEPPECACEGSGLVIEVADSGTAYHRAGYVDEYGEPHGEPCPCSKAREAFAESHTCAHCGRVAEIARHVTPDEPVCRECAGELS